MGGAIYRAVFGGPNYDEIPSDPEAIKFLAAWGFGHDPARWRDEINFDTLVANHELLLHSPRLHLNWGTVWHAAVLYPRTKHSYDRQSLSGTGMCLWLKREGFCDIMERRNSRGLSPVST